MAISRFLSEKKIVQIIAVASSPHLAELSDYAFRVYPSDDQEIRAIARFASTIVRKIVILIPNNSIGIIAESAFKAEFDQRKPEEIRIIRYDEFPAADRIIYNEMEFFDGIFVMGFDLNKFNNFASHLKQILPHIRIFSTSFNMFDNNTLINSLEGLVYSEADPFNPNDPTEYQARFVRNFINKYFKVPNKYSAYAFDAATVLIQAIRKSKDFDGPSIKSAIKMLTPFQGVMGMIRFDNNGELVPRPILIKEIVKGEIKLLGRI